MKIQFLWVLGHTGIEGNEFADKLAKASASIKLPPSSEIPWSDLIPNLRIFTTNLWLKHWGTFPPSLPPGTEISLQPSYRYPGFTTSIFPGEV